MRIVFRLGHVLQELGAAHRGVISEISEHSHIERHKLSKLRKNEAASISFETLVGICKYLIEEHQVPASELPGRLFALEADGLWSMLAQRNALHICYGVRETPTSPTVSWADSYLHGELQHALYGTAKEGLADQPNILEQMHVSAYRREDDPRKAKKETQRAREDGQKIYDEFHTVRGDRGLVCLGSVKSSVVVEILIASALKSAGAKSFVSQDDVAKPTDRSCPFYFRFRDDDPCPPSCYGGLYLSQQSTKRGPLQPGIYYEDEKGRWKCCPSSKTEDAALVFYWFRPLEGILEVCMGGFSGNATICLAKTLPKIAKKLWPPVYERHDLEVGAFLVHFRYKSDKSLTGADDEAFVPIRIARTRVIRLPAAALERRFT